MALLKLQSKLADWQDTQYPTSVVCEVLGYGRSTLYYQASAPANESAIRAAIVNVAGRYPKYGYRLEAVAAVVEEFDQGMEIP